MTPEDLYRGAAAVYCKALNERVPPDPNSPPEWPWNMRPEFRAAVDWAYRAGRDSFLRVKGNEARVVFEDDEPALPFDVRVSEALPPGRVMLVSRVGTAPDGTPIVSAVAADFDPPETTP